MKHKIQITLLFAFVQIINALNVSAEVYTGSCGTGVSWQLDTETEVLKIDGAGSMRNYPVRAPWYKYRASLKTVEIGNEVTEIGRNAFRGCSEITSIKLGASLLGDIYEFDGCHNIHSIVIDEGNTIYDSRDNCSAIIRKNTNTLIMGCINTTIPNGVTEIGSSAFVGSNCPKDIVIPASVTNIADGAFNGCTEINSIVVDKANATYNSENNCNAIIETATGTPILLCNNTIITSSVKNIDVDAFRAAGLTKIKVEEGHPLYDSRDNCNAIIETKTNTLLLGFDTSFIPTSVTRIGKGAFSKCTFSSINLPASLTVIESKAFSGCANLTEIKLPNTLTSISDSTFQGCSSLDNIIIPNSITSIGAGAFAGCELNNIIIPNSVTSIGEGAFEGCKLINFTFPSSVTTIAKRTFAYCKSAITIPNTVTSIGEEAFYGCAFTNITIPNSVTEIGTRAFSRTKLTSFTFPTSVTVIPDYVFQSCQNLQSVTIPNTVAVIGDGAFYQCDKLQNVDIAEGVQIIGRGAFHNCYSLKEITIPNSVGRIGTLAFTGCRELTSIFIPQSVYYIGDGILSGCPKVTSIVVDSNNAFYDSRGGCNAIIDKMTGKLLAGCKNTVIPTCVTSIGWCAFDGALGLQSITLPNTVKSIEAGAFNGCDFMKTINCYATTPPEFDFYSSFPNSLVDVYVPESSVAAYKAAKYWRNYNILPMDPATGVQNLHGDVNKQNEGGIMYDLTGCRICAPAKNGIYIQNGVKKVNK